MGSVIIYTQSSQAEYVIIYTQFSQAEYVIIYTQFSQAQYVSPLTLLALVSLRKKYDNLEGEFFL